MNKNNLCTIYVVRHGEAEHNVLGRTGKVFDPKLEGKSRLTSNGREQASNLAKKFKDIEFDEIFSSDYTRAKETAEILKLERKLAVQIKEAIRERQQGSWAGKWHLVKNKIHEELKALSEEDKMKYEFDDVETEEHAYARFNVFLREIAVAYPTKNILVVCHGNLMRTLLLKLGWAKYHELPSQSIENTGYYVVESDGTDFLLKEVVGVNKKSI